MDAADVRSLDAVRELHAATCKFRSEIIDGLASVDLTVRRANDWLSDQLNFWQRTIRETEDEVFQAKQELAQRKYVGFDGRVPDTTVQEEKLKRCQAKLRYAEDKVQKVRTWMRKLPTLVSEVYDGPAKHLAATVETDLPRGLALLERRIVALEEYLQIAPVSTPSTAPTPSTETTP